VRVLFDADDALGKLRTVQAVVTHCQGFDFHFDPEISKAKVIDRARSSRRCGSVTVASPG
jgi:hypothetical protein